MRILITGSRDWSDMRTIDDAISRAVYDLADPLADELTVVHGNARGADRMAATVALTQGLGIESHPADWGRYGKRAGFVRNAEMVKLGADVCLAFIRNNSKGASMTARLAREAGIPVREYRED